MLYCVYVGPILFFSSDSFPKALEQLGKLKTRKDEGNFPEEQHIFLVRERTLYNQDGEEYTESDRLILSWEK